LNLYDTRTVLAFDRSIRRDLAPVGPAAVAAIPLAVDVKHETPTFSPKAGDGCVFRRRWAVGGIGGLHSTTRRQIALLAIPTRGFPSKSGTDLATDISVSLRKPRCGRSANAYYCPRTWQEVYASGAAEWDAVMK
jgi:hypothetical protein